MILDGKKIAAEILSEIAKTVSFLRMKPGLAFILVGDNPASKSYVTAKNRECTKAGFHAKLIHLPETTSEAEVLSHVKTLNNDPLVHGILVQLPLPFPETKIMEAIDPNKDVDGFHPINAGKLLRGDPSAIVPCTPKGIQVLLERSNIPIYGKHVVIVGRSNIVGKPLAALLVQKKHGCNATVTICHSQSEHLIELTKSADILVAAIGQPRCIKKEMVKPGATVIDVGINRVDGKIVGDVDFEAVAKVASHITPVPGGIGPMTIAMLLSNTLQCYENAHL